MKISEEFCGQGNGYSRSITLRNRLIPIGKTEENLKKANMLESDFERAKAYVEVKNIIDDFHRSFIEDVLSKETLGLDAGRDFMFILAAACGVYAMLTLLRRELRQRKLDRA